MVEEAVGKRMGTQLPREYNVRTFGETIGGVAVVSGRRTPDECTAWFDEEFERKESSLAALEVTPQAIQLKIGCVSRFARCFAFDGSGLESAANGA